MDEEKRMLPIGVFDSGLGGLSVLRELIRQMPYEHYLYFGDSKNAPYGTKDRETVCALTVSATNELLKQGIKALVIACNTATGAAVGRIREQNKDLIVVSIEPAVKPACLFHRGKKVVAMATPLMLKQERFSNLCKRFCEPDQVIKVPCDGLVEFVERGELSGPALTRYLHDRLDPYINDDLGAVVLGCTHYPFIKDSLQSILPSRVQIYDGGDGTARELKRRLLGENLLRDEKDLGQILLMNSREETTHQVSISKEGKLISETTATGLFDLSLRLLQSE